MPTGQATRCWRSLSSSSRLRSHGRTASTIQRSRTRFRRRCRRRSAVSPMSLQPSQKRKRPLRRSFRRLRRIRSLPRGGRRQVAMASATNPLHTSQQVRRAPRSRAGRWRGAGGYLFLLPAVIYIAATMLYPVAYNVRMSVEDVNIRTFLSGNAPFIGLANYRTVIDDPAFRHAISVSLVFTGGSLLFQFTIGFAL